MEFYALSSYNSITGGLKLTKFYTGGLSPSAYSLTTKTTVSIPLFDASICRFEVAY
jgi:hypothetical protein